MGNYNQLEIDFVKRTLNLIEQYEQIKEQFPFEKQYNHTLLINCLLGLIVLPKEKAHSFVLKERMAFVKELEVSGIKKSIFNPDIKDTRELFQRLRNAIAHFDIEFHSDTPEFLIDRIAFQDSEAQMHIATFYSDELLPFILYYADALISNLERNG